MRNRFQGRPVKVQGEVLFPDKDGLNGPQGTKFGSRMSLSRGNKRIS